MTDIGNTFSEKKGPRKNADADRAKMEHVYAEINKEIASLMSSKEKIVFGPAEDFEYKVPFEDFQNSRETAAQAS